MQKKALICGISGQDGAYLAKLLLEKGYKVTGTSRDAQITSFSGLSKLGILDQVSLVSMAPSDYRSVLHTISSTEPDEIYNLSGQSSVALSYQQPVETFDSIVLATLNILEAIKFLDIRSKFYNASSGEIFGDTGGLPANENTAFNPKSPYGIAKATSVWQVRNYCESYGLFACSGILFNHESPLRPDRFITKKIVKGACNIVRGTANTLRLGNLNVARDWGWAPEYVDAMYRMLQRNEPSDYVIATGITTELVAFISKVFNTFSLNWQEYVVEDATLLRVNDIRKNYADPSKAKNELGWSSAKAVDDIIAMLIEAELSTPSELINTKKLA